jgi:cytochrome c oxidase subunit 1
METLNYLNNGHGAASWLLTRDHKRIALLYLVSITAFFFIGGLFAFMIRLELLTPAGDVMTADTYNKMFTMHGVVMVFFFLIPSIPAVLGNFLIPIMIGAKDLAFPRVNLLSWYIYILGGSIPAGRSIRRIAPRPPTATSSPRRWACSSPGSHRF